MSEPRRSLAMVEAERLFVERHRPLDEPPRPCKVALSLNKKSEVVEAGRRVGMFRAEPLLAHCQYALKERPRLRIGSATVKIPAALFRRSAHSGFAATSAIPFSQAIRRCGVNCAHRSHRVGLR